MLEVLILAFALSMDAFAVSIGLGIKEKKNTNITAFKAALFFGSFQALMPLLGYLGGKSINDYIQGYDVFIAFILLLFIGIKMIRESLEQQINQKIKRITNHLLFTLAIATSIDAMAAGFTLHLFKLNPFLSIFLIGITTFFCSYLGVYIGKLTGVKYEKKAEFLGGFILILIGFKILFLN
jgi:putative Mn2+ efflux pump MntP